jgi:hypothetical protein
VEIFGTLYNVNLECVSESVPKSIPGKFYTKVHFIYASINSQKDARFRYLILKVIIPSNPFTASFHFRIHVYIRLIVNELGIFGV